MQMDALENQNEHNRKMWPTHNEAQTHRAHTHHAALVCTFETTYAIFSPSLVKRVVPTFPAQNNTPENHKQIPNFCIRPTPGPQYGLQVHQYPCIVVRAYAPYTRVRAPIPWDKVRAGMYAN